MVPNGGKQVKFFGGPIVIVPSNKKKKPSDPSSQEAYNQNRTEESKHRDSVLPPTKTPCCCGGQGWPIRVSHSPPKKKDGVNLFVDFRRHFNDDVVFCVCVCVWVGCLVNGFGVEKDYLGLGACHIENHFLECCQTWILRIGIWLLEASSARKAPRISSGTDAPTKFDS